ncbi:hypothetical protein KIN20_017975 [Parelaphostrongylus tenuis]|uniref:Uncharacterized protein n=1 Tax=Parelaphostrongylus tenuis TaxID=148309 RepID=A0AAD5N1H1_PARTN|nr:hypothetical protein KIN20_017975 [Parelaphostrongylus tenuis]
MIHRAVLGSVERMTAILAENYGGKWPFWLSPRQAKITVHESVAPYAKTVKDRLYNAGFEVNNDSTIIQRDIILLILTEYNADKSVEGRSFMGGVKTRKLKNLVIKRQGSKYQIESNRAFDSLRELIEFYKTNTLQLNMFTLISKNSIKLQSWEYLHSDVKRGVLLGKGAFGEVKVSDFGLSLIGTTYLWCLVYEIFFDGAELWKGKTNVEVKIAVTNGECVQMRSCCPESLRCFIATRIFANNPEMRADMIGVVETFQRAYSESRTFRMRRKFASFEQDVSRRTGFSSVMSMGKPR